MAITDPAMGLKPAKGPLIVQYMEVGDTSVACGTTVKIVADTGVIIPVIATGAGQIGVALAGGANGDSVPVSVHPDTVYEAHFDTPFVLATHTGHYADITVEGNGGAGTYSDQEVNYTDGDLDTASVFIIVGTPGRIDDTSRVFVRLCQNDWILDHAS